MALVAMVLFLSNFFENTKVQDQDFYDIFSIESISANGYWAFITDLNHVNEKKLNNVNWVSCKKLNSNIDGFLRNHISNWDQEKSFLHFISEKDIYGYKVYIKTPSRIIFLKGFSDFGGSTPSEEEKNICEIM
jgi:hypothetical protein